MVEMTSIQQILEQDALARIKANELIRGKFQC
jgi:1-deoxy-D-xylulose-5-phosphate reductoisomerase